MRIFITVLLFVYFSSLFSQQFNFNQLIDMTKDNKMFEVKMIQKLNQIFEKRKNLSYSYSAEDGTIGSSNDIPTNDKKYEELYRFDDGKIYRESEIESRNLDTDYSIRNKLRKQGQPINGINCDGFKYVNSKLTSLIKSEYVKVGFGENYDNIEKTASTWYTWESQSYSKVLVQSKLFSTNYKKLTVQFVRDSDFSDILKQIMIVSKYIDTKEDYGSFVSEYKFGLFTITSERSENYNGGIITIYLQQK